MAGDIYSVSLLFWEIANRVHDTSYTLALSPEISGKNGVFRAKIKLLDNLHISSYSAITFEVMQTVHQMQLRPSALRNWPDQLHMIMSESWASRWQDRLTALRIFYNLKQIFPQLAQTV